MSRIADTFRALRTRREPALVAYVTAGDPDLDRSYQVLAEVARAGADLIELGVPFSDPSADGPAIAAAMHRALGAGTTLDRVLELAARLRAETSAPIILFGYYNPIFVRGADRFAAAAARAGADGVLVVDLPADEAAELAGPLAAHGLDYVPLLAPTSTEARIQAAARAARGFLYYVSVTGITGANRPDPEDVRARVAVVRAHTDLPIAVGFGVSTPEDARRIGAFADAVVVGSAIVRAAEQGGAAAAGRLVRELMAALKR
jgi:tryptophan synthase alpha chain